MFWWARDNMMSNVWFSCDSIWRPITGPVEDWPLAVSEAATVPPSCLVEADRIRPKYRGPLLYMLPQEGVKWHYLSKQRNDEALVMKIFDTKKGVAGCKSHPSFCLRTEHWFEIADSRRQIVLMRRSRSLTRRQIHCHGKASRFEPWYSATNRSNHCVIHVPT